MTTKASGATASGEPIDYAVFDSAIGLNWYLFDSVTRYAPLEPSALPAGV